MSDFPDCFNLADYFLYDRLAEDLGDKAAILYGARSYTYAGVAQRSQALSRWLRHNGLARSERVYVVLPDCPPFAWSIFATWDAGGVLAMGNPAAPVADLEYVIEYIDAAVLITTPAVVASLAPALQKQSGLRAVLLVPESATGEDPEQALRQAQGERDSFHVLPLAEAIAQGASLDLPRRTTHCDDPACWLFTSGSTGRPKAAMHCHRDFAFNSEAYAKGTVGYRRDDVTVSVPRLFFGYATGTNLMFPFAVGATTALFSEAPTVDSLARAIEMYRPTVLTNIPTMLGKLLAEKPDLDLSCLRFQLSAGEALPPTLLGRALERYGADVYDGIGSAEMFHIYCTNRPGDIRPGSLGRVVEGYELRILPADAGGPGAAECAPGETGILWVRGDSIATGYHRDRPKSWQTFHGHWCRTGDLFARDAEGYLWFRGRNDDLFKVGGKWVAPQEIEECLLQHASVAACVVAPYEVDGLTKPRALVVLKPGAEDRDLVVELQAHVRERRGPHKVPRLIEFVDDLPRNDRGKIDRKAVRS